MLRNISTVALWPVFGDDERMVFDSTEQKAMAFAASCDAEPGDSLGFGKERAIVAA